ncbi:MAG: glycosyltransferase [Dechloromonas sp.]|nr:glycosyltransferase [Dechloromonas sp.]
MHIAFGVNADFVFPMGVAIVSILQNNPGLPVRFHVFATSVSERDKARLQELHERFGVDIDLHLLDEDFWGRFVDFKFVGHFNPACFIRVMIPGYLANIADRVLYLDSDIICQGRLDGLVGLNLNGAIAACVRDFPEAEERQCKKFSLKSGEYFNSGMMLIDTVRWNDEGITERVFEMVQSGRSFEFADQDILNILLENRVLFFEKKWNLLKNSHDIFRAGLAGFSIPDDAIFVHFVGKMKPWHRVCLPESQGIFSSYKKVSPWVDVPLLWPIDSGYVRKFSAYLYRKGFYRKAVELRGVYFMMVLGKLWQAVRGNL